MPRKKKITEKQLKWARRYEAAWHECFWTLDEWRQIYIIEEPYGRAASELATNTRQLAENKEWKPKDNYREIPTGIAELKEVNKDPY